MEGLELYNAAHEAGMVAGRECVPVGVTFGVAKSLVGNEIVAGTESYLSEGVCGFAWVNVKPGNSRFANVLKKNGLARKSYYGGVDVWCSEFNQSMARKEAYAESFARVLNDNGIERAYAQSRMD